MLFNSLEFAAFFVLVYSLYLGLSHGWQNRMLLIASYVFYGAWDWRFLSLIWLSTIIDFVIGLKIHRSRNPKWRRVLLSLSIASNLIILGVFKYFNFFMDTLQHLLFNFGFNLQAPTINIILPVGISFYTFQTMSYTIDIYLGKLKPTHKLRDFALFVAFFPQLVAGPIERARHLLPQIMHPRTVTRTNVQMGCFLMFWGLFQKIFVADNLSKFVDPVFAAQPPYNGAAVLIAIYAFAFQIFCDFAGYSNIARGLGLCMGFDLMVNFNAPYLASNPQEFWRRWHISLSQWLRDYLYIPLGGNRNGAFQTGRNILVTMLLGGLWHGAAWTFILWGLYHGVLIAVYRQVGQKVRERFTFLNGHFWKPLQIILFFHLTCLGWLIFRAESVQQIGRMLYAVFFQIQWTDVPQLLYSTATLFSYIGLVLFVFIKQKREDDVLALYHMPYPFKLATYVACFYLLVIFGDYGSKSFIYFQF